MCIKAKMEPFWQWRLMPSTDRSADRTHACWCTGEVGAIRSWRFNEIEILFAGADWLIGVLPQGRGGGYNNPPGETQNITTRPVKRRI